MASQTKNGFNRIPLYLVDIPLEEAKEISSLDNAGKPIP